MTREINGSLSKIIAQSVANFREVGAQSTLAHDSSTKPILKENGVGSKLQEAVTPTQQPFRSRPDAPAFIPVGFNVSENIAQVMPAMPPIPASGRGSSTQVSVPISNDPHPNDNGSFQPLGHKDNDGNSLVKRNQPARTVRSTANTVSSIMQLSEHARDVPRQGSKISTQEKLANVENWGPLIPVTESKLNSSQEPTSKIDKHVSTYDFFGPLNENIKPPHQRAAEDPHPIRSGNDIPAEAQSEAAVLHEMNLLVIKDFARRAEALRRGDTSAIKAAEDEEDEENEKPLPAVSNQPKTGSTTFGSLAVSNGLRHR